MSETKRFDLPTTAAAAVAAIGVLVSHAFGYMVAAPDEVERVRLLEATGHRYLGIVTAVAVAAAVATLARYAARESRRSEAGITLGPRNLIPMTAIQTIGFLAMELVERMLSHGSGLNVLSEPAVIWGLCLQAVVVVLNLLLLRSLVTVVRKLRGSVRRSRVVRSSALPRPSRVFMSIPTPGKGAIALRGPPRPCLS